MKGEKRGIVCATITLLNITNILNVMAGTAEDCGGPAGPAQAGGGQGGRLHHRVLVLGAGPHLRRPGPAAGSAAASSLDQIHRPTILPGHVSYLLHLPTTLHLTCDKMQMIKGKMHIILNTLTFHFRWMDGLITAICDRLEAGGTRLGRAVATIWRGGQPTAPEPANPATSPVSL